LEFATLLRQTMKQGHAVGLHGNPRHARSLPALGREAKRLSVLSEAPVVQCRQHYLRIDPRSTLYNLDALGFKLDSSMGFNDRPGFRCGSCTPIRWWDLHRGQALRIRELAFSVGDFNLHDPTQFDVERSLAMVRGQAGWTLLAGGVMTLLFHELYFWEGDFPGHADFFSRALRDMERMGLRSLVP
jgi:hypothetical protein